MNSSRTLLIVDIYAEASDSLSFLVYVDITHIFAVESIKHFNNMKYVLLGCQIVVYGGDPVDDWIPLALSDNFEELALFADLQNLALLEVNKV